MKVAIYCRLSREDINKEEESESIKNQKNLLMNYVLAQDWEIEEIYVDEDFSGSDRNRPDFNRLIKDAENKRFDVVLCKSQSRFTRDLQIVEEYIHGKFLEWQIRFISLIDNADTYVKGNKKSRQINGLINEWYLEDLSDNIKAVLKDKQKKGVHIGSFAPYGYIKDPEEKGKLIIDDEAAAIVREIFDLYVTGTGMYRIAGLLNERGAPNPHTHKTSRGEKHNLATSTKKSAYWTNSTIQYILTNELYIGNMVQNKFKKASYKSSKLLRINKEDWIIVKNTHEPIIEQDIFNTVQNMKNNKKRPSTRSKKVHIFAGKVRCLECGERLTVTSSTKKAKYLRCSARAIAQESCIGSCIAFHRLENYVLNEINQLSKLYFDSEEIEDVIEKKLEYESHFNDRIENIKKRKKDLNSKLNNTEGALKSIYIDKVKKIISEDEFLQLKRQFSDDSKLIKNQIAKLDEEANKIEESMREHKNKKEIISKYQELKELNREVVNEFIETIYVGHKNKVNKQRTIKIIWKI